MNPYYTANTAFLVFAMMIMLAAVSFNTTLDAKRRQVTRLLFAVISVSAVCEWAGNWLQGASVNLIVLHKLVKFAEFSLAPSIGLICGRSLSSSSRWEKPMLYAVGVHALLELTSLFGGWIWYVDAQNYYHHGTFYWVYIAFYLIGVLYYLLQGIEVFRRYQQSGGIMVLLVTVFLASGIVISMMDNGVEIVWLVVAMAAIMLYKFYGDILQQVDGLTELGNRWAFEDYLSRYRGTGAILYFDVDHFKQINDTYGHAAGDQSLCAVAQQLRAVYGGSGRCFRLGGDEFCVVLRRNLTRIEELNEEFRRRQKQGSDPQQMPGVSVGYALFDTAEEPIEDAVERADAAMYQTKHASRHAPAHPAEIKTQI